jgi:hypothetical protein
VIGDDIQLGSSLPRLVGLFEHAASEKCEAAELDLQVLLGVNHSAQTAFDRIHVISLYLLWLSILGGQVARIGGVEREVRKPGGEWLQEREKFMQNSTMEERESKWMVLTNEVHDAIVDDNAIRYRLIITAGHCSTWHRAFLRRGVERMRELVWTTLTKAYMHAPLDASLVGDEKGGDDWLERMLFIDVQSMPLLSRHRNHPSNATVPDSWDDSVDHITTSLQSTTLQSQDEDLQIRASRLASMFEAFHLIESVKDDVPGNPLSRWSGRQVLQGGKPHLKLR